MPPLLLLKGLENPAPLWSKSCPLTNGFHLYAADMAEPAGHFSLALALWNWQRCHLSFSCINQWQSVQRKVIFLVTEKGICLSQALAFQLVDVGLFEVIGVHCRPTLNIMWSILKSSCPPLPTCRYHTHWGVNESSKLQEYEQKEDHDNRKATVNTPYTCTPNLGVNLV